MKKKVLIAGREEFTKNYENAVSAFGAVPIVSVEETSPKDYDLLLLPGGGDISPCFFNQPNLASRNIDYSLDRIQFSLLDLFIKSDKPVLGICKGMQLINIYFGGNLIQDMDESRLLVHSYQNGDSYHTIFFNSRASCFYAKSPELFPKKLRVNSAHHQCIDHLGEGLTVLHYSLDYVPETICHMHLPILAFQWHPERLWINGKNYLHPFLRHILNNS